MPSWTLISQIENLARKLKHEEIENFVEESIHSLLDQLYYDLKLCEETLFEPRVEGVSSDVVNIALAQNLVIPTQKLYGHKETGLHLFFVHSRIVDPKHVLNWMKHIYGPPSSPGENGDTGRHPRPKIVGPVGERPLHVCFLRANEFKSKSVEDQSIRRGILSGAKKYIEKDRWEEVTVPYGKDYCAAVGSIILLAKKNLQPCLVDRIDSWNTLLPPYYQFLVDWVKETYVCTTPPDEVSHDSEKLVSTGLYEGETVLYFSIASKDLETVRWLLDHNVKANQNLEGLFFRPKVRHCMANDGIQLLEWSRFFTRAKYCLNEFAATSNSYFGLNPIFFAASQGPNQECKHIMELLVDRAECVKLKAINQSDEYGNTPLHLAAWNGSVEIFTWLMEQKADLKAVNNDGLSPLSLTARYGLWDMFGFIRKKFLAHSMWQYGHVLCSDFDFSHIDSSRNIQDHKDNEAEKKRLCSILRLLEEKYPSKAPKLPCSLSETGPESSSLDHDTSWCFDRQSIMRSAALAIQDAKAEGAEQPGGFPFLKSRFIGTLEVIRLYRPEGWYDAIKDCVEDLALKKWRKCYHLVYIGETCIPTFVTFVLFGLMWQYRKLALMENSGVPGWFAPRPPADDLEAQCGWASIQNSLSGRLQAVLVIYGVIAMLGVAAMQQRIGIHELDAKRYNSKKRFNAADFFYLNLKAVFCTIASAMFIAIGTARVMAGPECKTVYLNAEKNATAIAGLFLFTNLLNMLRPIQIFGAFFITIFKMIVTDLFRFSVVYLSLFLAFLIAIQTLYAANNHFVTNLVADSLQNISDFPTRRKTTAGGSVRPSADDVMLCSAKIMSTSDTAYKMLTVSLGDGFSDILQDSRARQDPTCGGFQVDYLLSVIYFAWIVLTNILTMNLLIAMLSRTFTSNFEASRDNWILDIVARVIRYEISYPELRQRAHRPTRTTFSLKALREDISLALVCLPEARWLKWIAKGIWRCCCQRFLGITRASKMSTELRKFLGQDGQADTMPLLLDYLLNKDSGDVVVVEDILQQKHKNLEDDDVEFLKLGLAYHICRKQDSVRLSTKIIVKNYHNKEAGTEEEKEKVGKVKETATGGDGGGGGRNEMKSAQKLSQPDADMTHTAAMPTQNYASLPMVNYGSW
eukprot:CAMPEP_0172156042 /NCGR_PEP_ID=MMETSP1050-20130122/2967_1 /TAXON_ID=233186 /ORGANISM="Cryptomonas curvata, Strain CCAP979/52" /LENGTH=1139 /DNA_ID=CAMNT_0012825019 /DNA_START=308 /DNA_END=3727 /DNA_ORIENTATION=+